MAVLVTKEPLVGVHGQSGVRELAALLKATPTLNSRFPNTCSALVNPDVARNCEIDLNLDHTLLKGFFGDDQALRERE